MSWRSVGAVLPTRLNDARLELHFASQLVSAPGTTLLPAEADYSHTNLSWDSALDVLAGRPVGRQSLRAALVFESLELAVLDGPLERASHQLTGSTMQEALDWLGGAIGGGGPLSSPEHEMPAHPLRDNASFSGTRTDARAELAAWFANAAAAVRQATVDEPTASSVRCWPHHFDVASLITLDPGKGSDDARSIGVGFSPGDAFYDQPYFYVTPWPYPDAGALPPLSPGALWHTRGWTGAVLTGERIISVTADRQASAVQDALRSAIAACRILLGN